MQEWVSPGQGEAVSCQDWGCLEGQVGKGGLQTMLPDDISGQFQGNVFSLRSRRVFSFPFGIGTDMQEQASH